MLDYTYQSVLSGTIEECLQQLRSAAPQNKNLGFMLLSTDERLNLKDYRIYEEKTGQKVGTASHMNNTLRINSLSRQFPEARLALASVGANSQQHLVVMDHELNVCLDFTCYVNYKPVIIDHKTGTTNEVELSEEGYRILFNFGDGYFMAKEKYQLRRHHGTGSAMEGDLEALPIEMQYWEVVFPEEVQEGEMR